jgi:hypothetical protein
MPRACEMPPVWQRMQREARKGMIPGPILMDLHLSPYIALGFEKKRTTAKNSSSKIARTGPWSCLVKQAADILNDCRRVADDELRIGPFEAIQGCRTCGSGTYPP